MRYGSWARLLKGAIVLAGIAALAFLPTAATATPGSGVTAAELARGTSADSLDIRTKGPTDVVFRTVTIAPGGSTGWHYHPGKVLAVVKEGTLTRTKAKGCTVEVSGPGDTVLETGGPRDIHIGRNLGPEPVVLYLTYLIPKNAPLAVDADNPGCP
ncbi:cupin domain-containing protein [Streptomyces polyrhachis]|uniref:Cupin domain-containing protein n=1 Tax=Streptomyces polyrhachis TaxID=1282885 RepID=A0ABW2G766_9ACTN